jgi:hypothetical protein
MIPLNDENPSKTFPIVTIVLILVNLSVFAYQTIFRFSAGCLNWRDPARVVSPGLPTSVALWPVLF